MTKQELESELVLERLADVGFKEKIVDVDEATDSFLIFRVAEHLFAFKGVQVREIISGASVIWVPGATSLLPGVLNVRGEVVAAIALRQVLSLPASKEGGGSFFILLRQGDGRSAVIVDEIVDVFELPFSASKPPLSSLNETVLRFAAAGFVYAEKIVTVLDVDIILETVTL